VRIFFGAGTAAVVAGGVGQTGMAAEAVAALALGALAGGTDAAAGLSTRAPGAGCIKGAGLGGKTAEPQGDGAGAASGKIGTVDTARGLALMGAGTSTGCSSRDTSRSPEPALFASA
jgi:hypothetical protein